MADKPDDRGVTLPREAEDTITYIPEPGMPNVHEQYGVPVKFPANVPVKVKRSITVQQLHKVETTMNDGTIVTRSVEKRVPLAEVLKGNHSFSINGAPPPKKVAAFRNLPTTPDAYRGHAIAWVAKVEDLSTLDALWAAEQELRDSVGFTDADMGSLGGFLEARRALLSGAARMVAAG